MAMHSEEREISLTGLFVHILLRWRTIVTWMLIGAILFGGYSYYDSVQTAKRQEELAQKQKEVMSLSSDASETLTVEQLNNVDMVRQYESFCDYFDQSLLMKISPAEIPCAKILYAVKSDNFEESKDIRKIYDALIAGGFLQWLEKRVEEPIMPGLSELITVETAILAQEDSTVLEVRIWHVSAKECKMLSSYLKEYMEEQSNLLQTKWGEHELICISESFEVVTDYNLLRTQKDLFDHIEVAHADATALKKKFTVEQSRYYEQLLKGESESEETESVVVQTPSVSIKQIIIGAIVFALIYALMVAVNYIFSTKIKVADNLTDMYGIAQLGKIMKTIPEKRLFRKLDLCIYRIQSRSKRIFSEAESINLAISSVKIAAKKNELSKILCIGTSWNEKMLQIAEKMRVALEKEEIEMVLINNVLYDSESMEQLDGAEAGFLLEGIGVAFYDEIQKELELLGRQDIMCLGIVSVDI